MGENLSAKQEMQVQSLGQEDALEKGAATHSTILVWRNPWTEEPGGLQFMGSKESEPVFNHFFPYYCVVWTLQEADAKTRWEMQKNL